MAQIRFYANECSISNILFSKVFWTYAVSRINDESVGDNDMSGEKKEECLFDSQVKSKYINLIVYGTPGCGKSWHVKNELLKDYKTDNIIRTTFYQDYTNTDFVGQIMPIVTGEDVTYKFNPGPFTLALKKAIEVPNEPVALVIEELNRGNAPSIFGDIFQLLDRENGKSEYQITNVNIQKYLSDNIPDRVIPLTAYQKPLFAVSLEIVPASESHRNVALLISSQSHITLEWSFSCQGTREKNIPQGVTFKTPFFVRFLKTFLFSLKLHNKKAVT